jgi:protein-tyrosine phosphatase
MIDTHLHILPGVDDGPETTEEALTLAKALVQEGVHTAIATPHYNDLYPRRAAAEISARADELQQALDQRQIPLRLFAGHEALIGPGLVEDIQVGRLATLNGSRYLLLELWNNDWLPDTERVIFELRAFGIIPIIAHPERYRTIQKNPQRLLSLERQGVLAQLTANSLIGMQGNTARRCAETLLKKGLIQCISSDAHGLSKRPPALVQSLPQVVKLIGKARTQQLIEDCPMSIINDLPWRTPG